MANYIHAVLTNVDGSSVTDNDTVIYPTTTSDDVNMAYSNSNVPSNLTTLSNLVNKLDTSAFGNRIELSTSVSLNSLTLSDKSANVKRYICLDATNAAKVTNSPVSGIPFILDVELVGWSSASSYKTIQTVRANNASYSANNVYYTRTCTNGTWTSWVKYGSTQMETEDAGFYGLNSNQYSSLKTLISNIVTSGTVSTFKALTTSEIQTIISSSVAP